MANKNIPNDLNYLIELIRFTNDILDMNISFSIFKNRTIDDIYYVKTTIKIIEKKFTESDLTRSEYLMYLKRIKSVKDNYIMLLENIVRGKYYLSEHLLSFFPEFSKISGEQKSSSKQIQNSLSRKSDFQRNDNQISNDELKHLFTPEEE